MSLSEHLKRTDLEETLLAKLETSYQFVSNFMPLVPLLLDQMTLRPSRANDLAAFWSIQLEQ